MGSSRAQAEVSYRRRAVALTLCLALGAAANCKRATEGSAAKHETTLEDPRAKARELLQAEHSSCFLAEQSYCLSDDALLDDVIRRTLRGKALEKLYGGEMPSTLSGVKEVVRRGKKRYALAQLETAERRAQVRARVWQRYREPAIDASDGTVDADFGYLPGPFAKRRAGWAIESPEHLVASEWDGREAGRAFQQLAARHPTAKQFALRLRIQIHSVVNRWTYRYSKDNDRVTVARDGHPGHWRSRPLGGRFDALVDGSLSLHSSRLSSCSQHSGETSCKAPREP